MEIIYEDARVIAVAKPAGVEVIPGRGPRLEGSSPPLCAQLELRLAAKVFTIHRLDRQASGIVLFAKDAQAHRALSMSFERREVRKTYLALALGSVARGGAIKDPIREFGSGRMGVDPRGKASETLVRVLRRFKTATLLEARPITGRRHQIRVHLYALGHPVLGDTSYGASRPVGGAPRLMLHGLELAVEGPAGRPLLLRCEPPEDFNSVVESQSP